MSPASPEAAFRVLREGDAGRPIYMFAGTSGNVRELAILGQQLPPDRPVLGVEPYTLEADGRRPRTVEALAAQSLAAIRRHQPQGPYDLIGYSFGGLVVLEVARRMREAGDVVGLVGLIDPIYHRRFWPLHLIATWVARRTRSKLGAFLSGRGRPVVRSNEPPAWMGRGLPPAILAGPPTPELALQIVLAEAMDEHKPQAYPDAVRLFHSAFDYGCDPEDLWRPLLGGLQARAVPGNHRTVLQDPGHVAILAGHLADGLPPDAAA